VSLSFYQCHSASLHSCRWSSMPLTSGRQSANARNHWRNEFPFAASGIGMQLALRLKLCLRTFCVFVLLPVSFCQPTPFLRIHLEYSVADGVACRSLVGVNQLMPETTGVMNSRLLCPFTSVILPAYTFSANSLGPCRPSTTWGPRTGFVTTHPT
jgi:hypothetical protein